MALGRRPEAPSRDPIAAPEDPRVGAKLPSLFATKRWLDFLNGLGEDIDAAPVVALEAVVRRTGQHASIGTTPFPLADLPAGLWRVSYYVRVTTPGSVSSSLQVRIAWTDGVACGDTFAAVATNLTTSHQFGTLVIRVDEDGPISFETIYLDGGGIQAMQYSFYATVEAVALEEAA